MMTHEQIRKALSGPVPSVRMPFNKDGSIDYESLRGMVDFDIDAGAKTIMLLWATVYTPSSPTTTWLK